MKYKFLVCPS